MLEILFYVSLICIIVEKVHDQCFRYKLCVYIHINQTKYKIISLMIYCFLFFLFTLFRYLFFEFFEHQRSKKEVANFEMLKKKNKQTNEQKYQTHT